MNRRFIAGSFDRIARIVIGVSGALLGGAPMSNAAAQTPATQTQPPAQLFSNPGSGLRGPATTPTPVVPAFDLKGKWTAVITEDWRFRMVVPAKGDYASVPLNDAGKKAAEQWDPEKDQANGTACRGFGVGTIMRLPLRVNISENSDGSWRIETDHGQQVRTLYFNAADAAKVSERTWQGTSVASWEGSVLKVVTKNMRAGYLRRNGVPYSENAVITESYIRHSEGTAGDWFTVSTVVDDPTYLREPFVTSSSFKRITNDNEWQPSPCVSEWGPLKERDFPDPFKI